MDKVILKKFAIESRQELMDKVRGKIKLFYVDEDFNSEQKGDIYILSNEKHTLSLTNEELKKRELLVKRIKELSLEQVIEEASYTWFNRIIAIRYMEINDILPLTKDNQSLGIRVLSSKDNTSDPEILKFTNLMNPELDIDFKKEKYIDLKDENEKFKYILLLVCKKLGKVIPQVFDGVTDYIDILIPDNLLNDAGFITKVINEVPEENYNQVEIIGWLYQYYNQTEKDRVISAKKTYKKNEIAYATQLFTPDWIVKYMVENSLGKYWIEHSNNDTLIDNWKYFIKDNITKSQDELNPTEITFIDPCCGSGHILIYAFEVLYQIYLSAGYNKNDIPELILKNNLYGLDIDDRAGQLSILSVLLKAREYDKNIFNKEIVKNLNIMSIQESNTINCSGVEYITSEIEKNNARYLIDNFKNAKEIGSLLILENKDYSSLIKEIKNDNTIFGIEIREKLLPIIKVANILTKRYDVVVTNPPYMNSSVMPINLKKYIDRNYNSVKNDMFSAFIVKNKVLNKSTGYLGFMTPYVWMFISSYENLRELIINKMSISSLIQLEYSAFEEATVPICTFVLKNSNSDYCGSYYKLSSFTGGMRIQEEKFLYALNNNVQYKYNQKSSAFNQLSGKQIAFWVSNKVFEIFKNEKALSDFGEAREGMHTGDTNKYIRMWAEIDFDKFSDKENSVEAIDIHNKKWIAYNKGGAYRKWYGNKDYAVAFDLNTREEMKLLKGHVRPSQHLYFKKGMTWTLISSSNFGIRCFDSGMMFDVSSHSFFCNEQYYYYIAAFMNTKIAKMFLDLLNPTLNFSSGVVRKVPIIYDNSKKDTINKITLECINISKEDWDSFETSWDFQTHPLLYETIMTLQQITKKQANVFKVCNNLEEAYTHWDRSSTKRFNKLKQNEEELNHIFIDIYGLQEELTPVVEDTDITIRKADKVREIKSLISYAVGCMFGRYSLDEQGLVYAGGEFDINKYKTFKADIDNIIPITDEAYFSDDIVERFKTFIKTVYGDDTFNENMDFIAEALGKKGTETSEETIRRYFVNNFFNDHCKIYQKRPIYWLLDSGKKNGFKALIYMHRYNENLIPKVRLDYLHRVQTTYEKLLSDVNYKLTTDLSMVDKKDAQKRQADLNAKLQEIKEYDEKIAHIANQRISIDLDDGVKVNYEKFKDILAKIK